MKEHVRCNSLITPDGAVAAAFFFLWVDRGIAGDLQCVTNAMVIEKGNGDGNDERRQRRTTAMTMMTNDDDDGWRSNYSVMNDEGTKISRRLDVWYLFVVFVLVVP
jgi:hypothetical protein